jgi:hypothetical protein
MVGPVASMAADPSSRRLTRSDPPSESARMLLVMLMVAFWDLVAAPTSWDRL